MEVHEYARMYEAEDRSWWFRGRRRVVEQVVASLALPAEARIVDVGCGTGGNLPMLARHGGVVGIEPSPEARRFARSRGAAAIAEGDAYATGLEECMADLVTLLDVLEHLRDEARALAEVRRVLRPGAPLLVTVPAFMTLWSAHDEVLHHERRYVKRGLRRVLEDAGFTIDWLTYYNAGLFPAVAAVRVARRALPGRGAARADGAELPPLPLNLALEELFAAERHVVGRLPLPFGVSLIGVARAPA